MRIREKKHVLPKQPFFVLATQYYSKLMLNKYNISHFYSFHSGQQKDQKLLVVPDGCADVIFCYKQGKSWGRIYGTVTKSQPAYEEMRGDFRMFGVRFKPGIIPFGFELKMADVVNQYIPLEDVVKDKNFVEKMLLARDFGQRLDIFMKYYLSFYKENTPSLTEYVRREIVDSAGMASIADIAEETGYSDRHVIREMKKEYGMTPKQFARIVRYQHLLDHLTLTEDEEIEYAELAVQLGYYDQAHMIKNFKEYTGMSPRKYLKLMKQEHFSKRLILS